MNKKTAKGIPTNSIEKPEDDINIETLSLQSLGVYLLFEPISTESAKSLCEFIIKANYVFPVDQPLTIIINSIGGSVYDGFGIIDLMECSRLNIQTVAIGEVASMAALIFTGGTKGMRVMSKNSFIMSHQFTNYFEGKYHEFIAQRPHEDEIHARFIQHFIKNSKMSEKQIKEILLGSSDNWISAKESLKYGLCDKIADPWT